jgi:hypothetical protein
LRPANRHMQATTFFCWHKSKLHRQDYYSALLQEFLLKQ